MQATIKAFCAVMFSGMILLSAGCGNRRPQPADRNLAREILQAALEAWKKGETPAVLQQQDPPIVIADREWANGTKLLDFKVDDRDQLLGAGLHCTVQLTFNGVARGKPLTRKARYSVGTDQLFTVVREDDD